MPVIILSPVISSCEVGSFPVLYFGRVKSFRQFLGVLTVRQGVHVGVIVDYIDIHSRRFLDVNLQMSKNVLFAESKSRSQRKRFKFYNKVYIIISRFWWIHLIFCWQQETHCEDIHPQNALFRYSHQNWSGHRDVLACKGTEILQTEFGYQKENMYTLSIHMAIG